MLTLYIFTIDPDHEETTIDLFMNFAAFMIIMELDNMVSQIGISYDELEFLKEENKDFKFKDIPYKEETTLQWYHCFYCLNFICSSFLFILLTTLCTVAYMGVYAAMA